MSTILKYLKNCTSEQEIYELFRDEILPNRGKSHFKDEKILVTNSGNVLGSIFIRVKGIYELLARLLIYLKFNGYMQSIPQNTGETSYVSRIQVLLEELSNLFGNDIKNFSDITYEHIDLFILEHLNNKKSKAQLVDDRIKLLIEWIEWANLYLPSFLKVERDILNSSTQYTLLKKKVSEERVNFYNKIVSVKKPYPLDNINDILTFSINFIENYGDDCLDIAKALIDTKSINQYQDRKNLFLYFKNKRTKYKEPTLLNIQMKTRGLQGSSRDMVDAVDNLRSSPINMLNTFEASCVCIVLMLTGMRVGELTTLQRFPEIRTDEYFNLNRVIYKTATNKDGDDLEMPIPEIATKAIRYLSKYAKLKDGKKIGNIIISPLNRLKIKDVRTNRINDLLEHFGKKLNIEKMPEPHQFRHAMAFLIVHLNESDGLELARMFLGHTSITMTLQYMGHFNLELKDAIEELTLEESEVLIDAVTGEIQNNRKLFGDKGERLMPNHEFTGKQAKEFSLLLRKGLKKLVEEKKLAIIQTPVSLCMHDLSKPEQMVCQRGFNIEEMVVNTPSPSRCQGANCSNALFFEAHIEKLKKNIYADIDPYLKERLEENTHFMEAGGFEQEPFRKLIKEYDEYKGESA